MIAQGEKSIVKVTLQEHQRFLAILINTGDFASRLDLEPIGLRFIFDLKWDSGGDSALGDVSDAVGKGWFPASKNQRQNQTGQNDDGESGNEPHLFCASDPFVPVEASGSQGCSSFAAALLRVGLHSDESKGPFRSGPAFGEVESEYERVVRRPLRFVAPEGVARYRSLEV